ncbi:transglycosylase SLT domain-containing protein [Halobacteriovorax sp. GB3]|uniref:lytic transglycosylase domain-containing protein n=1 Tax=Halobacteriovorax sp. GB3 TaxID=2719615 RepID=UPI002360A38E|nr:lytic transglycosylase domain-containing protein [Halobacteriovorax sp. GB3]MDD0852604.1 transglycosylase SLT domain-containing protein [Halobacteriovorax sp. GB3]
MDVIFKHTKVVKVLAIAALFSGCATQSNQKSDNDVAKSVKQPISKHKAWTLEAQDYHATHDDPNSITGSALIEKPGLYEGKTYFLYGAEHLNLENYYFDIPVVYNRAVKKWINYFLNRGRGFFERYGARAGRYAPVLGKILEDHGLPRDLIFLAMAESGFQNKAKSWAKAVGPWQFMPYTGRRYGLHIDWYIDERRDPIKATIAASKYLKKLYGDFGAWELAAAAYNAGEGKMSRAIRRYRTENFWRIRKGRYLKPETKNYVPKIMALAIIGKNLKSFGFEEIEFHEPLDFEEVKVQGGTDLMMVAQALDVEFEEIQRLNPEVLRWFIPNSIESYTLRVPVGKKVAWNECCREAKLLASDFQNYRVRGSRTTLKDVARKFKIKDPKVLLALNPVVKSTRSRLKKGEKISIPFRQGQSKRAPMYADLYEKPRKSVVRKRRYSKRIHIAKRRGKRITNPKKYYTVRSGDSLWSVSRKTGTSLDTLIVSNLNIIKHRMIRAGDKLIVE